MIIFDTETTGLIENEALPLSSQPRILELGVLKVDFALTVLDEFTALIRPDGYEMTEVINKITGITQEDLVSKGVAFARALPGLRRIFLGEDTMLCMNSRFDQMMLAYELQRIEQHYRFPWPHVHIDAREMSGGSLQDWAKCLGIESQQRHRALDDCILLLECYRKYMADIDKEFK